MKVLIFIFSINDTIKQTKSFSPADSTLRHHYLLWPWITLTSSWPFLLWLSDRTLHPIHGGQRTSRTELVTMATTVGFLQVRRTDTFTTEINSDHDSSRRSHTHHKPACGGDAGAVGVAKVPNRKSSVTFTCSSRAAVQTASEERNPDSFRVRCSDLVLFTLWVSSVFVTCRLFPLMNVRWSDPPWCPPPIVSLVWSVH